MQGIISEKDFLDILRSGIDRTSDYMHQLTNYHGGPTTTEYILTSDIARAFLEKGHEVHVEYLNRNIANGYAKKEGKSHSIIKFGKKRTDVVVTHSKLLPRAMVEIKIGIRNTLGLIKQDLEKIAGTLEYLKAGIAAEVRAAVVFQTYIAGSSNDFEITNLKKRMIKREDKLKASLAKFGAGWPQFTFELTPLQDGNSGYSPTQVYEHPEEEWEIGENGHVTRYYAIIIKSLRVEQSNQPSWRRHSNG